MTGNEKNLYTDHLIPIKANGHFQASSHMVYCKNPLDSYIKCYIKQSWLIVLASFIINGVIFGIINSFGVIYVYLLHYFKDVKDAAFLTALVGSGLAGTTFLCSPISSIITDRYGIRVATFTGGLLATIGMILSSFCTSIYQLYFTYSFIIGLGSSLCYSPSLVILGHYFNKKLGLVNGIATSGSSTFTVIIPFILKILLKHNSIFFTMRWLSCLTASIVLCSLTFKEKSNKDKPNLNDLNSKNSSENLKNNIQIDLINADIWKNNRYKLWVLAFPIALFGYFVPSFHLVKHVADILPTANGELLVTTIGATSGIGRLIFGQVADLQFINPIVLQQIALIIMGSCTMLYSFTSNYTTIFTLSVFFGIFEGCFVSLLGPVVYNLVGQNGASQAIGFVLGFSSIPFIIGPSAAGYLYDIQGNYFYTFIYASLPFFVGAVLMIPTIRSNKSTDHTKEESSNLLNEKQNGYLGIANGSTKSELDKLVNLLDDKNFTSIPI